MYYSKRGIVAPVLIGLLLLIAGALILLFFLARADIPGFTEDKTCQLSVISRATTPSFGQGYIPLRCDPKHYCITDSLFGKCEQFAGLDNVIRIKVPGDDAQEAADIIEKITAERMFECWNDMGRGRYDLFTNEGFESILGLDWLDGLFGDSRENYPLCRVCSRVALDSDFIYEGEEDEMKRNPSVYFKSVSQEIKVHEYLENTHSPSNNGLTYLQEFTDRQIVKYPEEFKQEYATENEGDIKVVDEMAILFMQVISQGEPDLEFDGKIAGNTAALGGVLIVGAVVLTPVGALVGASGILMAMAGVGATSVASGYLAAQADSNEKAISVASCGELETVKELGDGEKLFGCSVVRPVDYDDIDKLNDLCRNPGELYA